MEYINWEETNMKKRILALTLALAMVFSLAACGSKTEETKAADAAGEEAITL